MTSHIEFFLQLKEFRTTLRTPLRLDTRFAVRDGARKLIISERSGGVELYDLARDPSERANLLQEGAEDGAGLRAWLETWLRNAKASARPQARIALCPGEIERLRRLGYF